MATAQKKTAAAVKAVSSAAKAAMPTSDQMASQAFSAMETTRNSAESFVRLGADTAKEFFASSTGEASKAHDKVYAIGREGAENLSRVVDACARSLNDTVTMFRQNADAVIEVCHITADISKTINSEIVTYTNNNFVENIELCKEAFSCRNANDFIEVQNKWFSTNMEGAFNQSAKVAEMMFQLFSEAAEPINERMTEAAERFSKSFSAK